MLISLNWLSDYIDVPFTSAELADRLTMLGIEVDSIQNPGERMRGVVVGEILEVTAHPNADKLRLTKVDIGTAEPLRIVCGAPNARTGLKVAVATIGTDLGEGFVIRKSKIRGEVSEGMLCSERELGLSESHEGIWELPMHLAVGAPLANALGKNDVIFEIGITPNRADCLSHFGIAREIHVLTGGTLKTPDVSASKTAGHLGELVSISLPEPELCPRYMAKLVRNVKVKPSPDWLKSRLEAVGLRPINNVVDVTNFVLMECGHPLHAFDFSTVAAGKIVVRTADGFADEYVTLDGKTRSLPWHALLITDGIKPLGIAGVMGGENSSITEKTTDVLIESAYFNPTSIRKTAKRLGLSTDASYRFERGTDIDVLGYAVERAARLIAELAEGTVVEGTLDEYPKPLTPKTFQFRPERCDLLLGLKVDREEMKQAFERLHIRVDASKPAEWQLIAPSYRVDLEREEDAIEEIARVIGYENIPLSKFEHSPLTGSRNPLSAREFEMLFRTTMLALGATECVSTPLVSEKEAAHFAEFPVEIVNPLNIERNRMRTSIAGNLLEIAQHNERFSVEGQRLFEMGSVFHYVEEDQFLGRVLERPEIAILLSGVQEPKTPYNAQPLKADVLLMKGLMEVLLGRLGISEIKFGEIGGSFGSWKKAAGTLDPELSLSVQHNGIPLAIFGRASEKITKVYDLRSEPCLAILDHKAIYDLSRAARAESRQVEPLPKYPSVERDLALILSHDVKALQVTDLIREVAHKDILRDVHVFDEFQSAEMKATGERSLAFHLELRSDTHTLEEREVDDLIILILKRLESELHARLRA
jgi:phenylalanyl-tRNA synthetase beta chain